MEPSTPSGLPGKARDFVVDVHNVHLDRRGGSEPLAISHSRSQMETVREPPQVRDSGFADTTSKWSGEKWGGGGEREGSALFWPPSFRQTCRVRTAMSALPSSSLQTHPSTFLSPYSCYSWPSSPPWLLTSAMLYTMSLCPSSQYPCARVLRPCEETKAARDQGTSMVR